MWEKDEHNQFFWALLLVTAGAVWTAVNLGLISDQIIKYWPMVLVLIGLWKLLHRSVLHE
jgi:Domain of unknown function (DUF5668)